MFLFGHSYCINIVTVSNSFFYFIYSDDAVPSLVALVVNVDFHLDVLNFITLSASSSDRGRRFCPLPERERELLNLLVEWDHLNGINIALTMYLN